MSNQKCFPRKYEFEICSFNEMCFQPMICSPQLECKCPQNQFFELNSSICKEKYFYNFGCNLNIECRTDLGLNCLNNKCSCVDNRKTWSFKTKKCLLSYAKSTCSSNGECNDSENLVCRFDDCNCPKESIYQMCDCSRQIGDENYWNGTKCIEAKKFGEQCKNDYECQTMTQKTKCINFNCECLETHKFYWDAISCSPKKKYGQNCYSSNQCLDSELTYCNSSFKCDCLSSQYFNTIDLKCLPKVWELDYCFPNMTNMCHSPMECRYNHLCSCSFGEFFHGLHCVAQYLHGAPCQKNHECAEYKGLSCKNNVCLCNDSKKTWSWNSTECKLTYGSSGCMGNAYCNEYEKLFCRFDNNSCFLTNLGSVCDCIKEPGNEYYWDGTRCLEAKLFGGSCNGDCECKTLSQFTTCFDGFCSCKPENFFAKDKCRFCYSNEFFFENSCFSFFNNTMKYSDSQDYCKSMNDMELASIYNQNIFQFFKLHTLPNKDYWLGIQEANLIGNDSNSIIYNAQGGPENCPYWISSTTSISFSKCNEEKKFICEKSFS